MIDRRLREALARRLGVEIVSARRLSGGDINEAYAVELAGAAPLFLKTNSRAPATMFSSEAAGLDWLRGAGALRIPRVLAFSAPGEAPAYLALELLEPASRQRSFDETLGRGLAALHRATPASFGLDHDNFIGSLPQDNTPEPTWAAFYRSRRLEPQLRLAMNTGRATPAMRSGFERLFAHLEALVGGPEPPSRLHGDLWGGNLHVDGGGQPCLIDPAVYGGHREMDLAMMRLFGGFSERVFAAYAEAYPLTPGADERVPLCQLYPLMVHVNLFGGGYVTSVEHTLRSYV